MGRARDPRRDQAFELWKESGGTALLKDIADSLGLPESTIRGWKTKDNWDGQLNGTLQKNQRSAPKKRGAPKGSKNAIGNSGGPGGPLRNKKALTTGEYEAIWLDCLDDEEKKLYEQINTDPKSQAKNEIALYELRERRMLKRIQNLMAGLTEKEKTEIQELRKTKQPYTTPDGDNITINVMDLVVTQVEEKIFRKFDDIIKAEEALTRVQDKKQRAIDNLHRMEINEEQLKVAQEKLGVDKEKLEIEKAKAGKEKGQEAEEWATALKEVANKRRAKVNNHEQ